MKPKKLIAALLIIAAVSIVATVFFLNVNKVETHILDCYLTVGYSVGFNVETDAIKFGVIRPGGYGTRYLNLSHHNEEPLFVQVSAAGQIKDWIAVKENNFLLDPGSVKLLDIQAAVPKDAEFGDYTCKIYVEFIRP